jgi:hypothetical protein
LQGEQGAAWISDFTLHSIGVLLFRHEGVGQWYRACSHYGESRTCRLFAVNLSYGHRLPNRRLRRHRA